MKKLPLEVIERAISDYQKLLDTRPEIPRELERGLIRYCDTKGFNVVNPDHGYQEWFDLFKPDVKASGMFWFPLPTRINIAYDGVKSRLKVLKAMRNDILNQTKNE